MWGRLDPLERSLVHLIETANDLKACGCGFCSLTEAIDRSTTNGELVFHFFDAMAQFKPALVVRRTRGGLATAKQRCVKLGRRRVLTPHQVEHAR